MRQRRELTKEQIEFRGKILKLKPKFVKEMPLPTPQKVTTRNEYMNHCMFWINEAEEGRYKERFMKAVMYLRDYCNQIINENPLISDPGSS